MQMNRREPPSQLLVLLPSLVLGGLMRHACDVVKQATRNGRRAAIVSTAAASPLPSWASDVDIRVLDSWEALDLNDFPRMFRDSDVLLLSSPETANAAPFLRDAHSAVIGVHGAPGISSAWLGPERFGMLATAVRSGRLRILVPGQTYVDGIAQEFGVPPTQVAVLPNAVDVSAVSGDAPEPQTRSILAPMRLSSDKYYVLEAAMLLASHTGLPLTVVGEGWAAQEMRARIADIGNARLIETGEIAPFIQDADIVVAVGLVALEAAARGRKVAVAAKPEGKLSAAITPATWSTLQATNFSGLGLQPQTPAQVWADLQAMKAADLLAVRRLVEEKASPRAMLALIESHLRPARTKTWMTRLTGWLR